MEGPKTVGPPVHQRAKQKDGKMQKCAAEQTSTSLVDEATTRSRANTPPPTPVPPRFNASSEDCESQDAMRLHWSLESLLWDLTHHP